MSEHQLVRAVRRGDDRAFEQLFSRYRRRISAYVYGLVADHGRAEDITQEVFMAALRRLRETEAPIAFKPWIYEIARNACIDEFRRSRRSSVVSFEDEPPERAAQVPLLADHGSPEMRWERKQQLGHLCGAFSGLSDNHHRILVLRELEGLSYREIAERMGMSRPVVESTLFRARRRLSQEYDELSSGRRCADVRTALEGHGTRSLSSLGLRQRRRIALHLDHCETCLHVARTVGVDASALRETGLARRVAALLPFGWLRIRRGFSRWSNGHSAGSANVAQLAGGTGPAAVVGPAIAAAAALLIAGGALPGAGHSSHAGRSSITGPGNGRTTLATSAASSLAAGRTRPRAHAAVRPQSGQAVGAAMRAPQRVSRAGGRPGTHAPAGPIARRSGASGAPAGGGPGTALPGVVAGVSGKAVSAGEQLLGAATGALGQATSALSQTTGALSQTVTKVTAPAPVIGQAAAQASQLAGSAVSTTSQASHLAGSAVSTTSQAAGTAAASATHAVGSVISGAANTATAVTGLTPPPGG